ncbi:Uncharacterised protein [Mycoplasmopsis californica]|uniref:Lipoprotein 17-related variable surface protein n=1 Tax=Mycoplasmopsis equigenitalium TaxID=114883 RepID=A0ABY5J0A0_9BACT|nr:lipoprotein 17-related variable surface protein [Mycoplasmopsis equigenitalium]UUD36695.1 lipoprotein 17-related variable surface protein [Mycoplasmopsis equigenitalium]VEU69343.1 Uncharacterised protein [Mycoplasmopsis californica]
MNKKIFLFTLGGVSALALPTLAISCSKNPIDEVISAIKDVNAKTKTLPSEAVYTTIQDIDKATDAGLEALAKKHGVEIQVSNSDNRPKDGEKIVTLLIQKGSDSKEKKLIIKGFKTSAEVEQDQADVNAVAAEFGKLKDLQTTNNKTKLASDVTYADFKALDDDLSNDLAALLVNDVKAELTNNVEKKPEGIQVLTIKLSKGHAKPKTVELLVSGFLKDPAVIDQENVDAVADALSKLTNLITLNNTSKLPSVVNYASLTELDADLDADLAALVTNEVQVAITVLANGNDDKKGEKTITLSVSKNKAVVKSVNLVITGYSKS